LGKQSYARAKISDNSFMEKPDPQIAELVRQLRAKLDEGKTPRIPWGLFEAVIQTRGLAPHEFEHAGYFHAEVVAGVGAYDEIVAEFIGDNETAFRRFCKDTGLNSKFQRPQPPHW
jgi:hypothetical protein